MSSAYIVYRALIRLGRTAGLADKLDVAYALGRLTKNEYTELLGLLPTQGGK